MNSSPARLVAIGLLGVALVGCAPMSSVEPSPATDEAVAWREPAAYEATIEVECGERDAAYGKWRVAVRNGGVVDAVPLNERAELTAGIESVPGPPTIGEVLAEAHSADAEGAESVIIEQGPDGVPLSVEVDYELDVEDDEACWTISDFVEESDA